MSGFNNFGAGVNNETRWNMSEAFLLSLINLRERITNYAITGDVFGWYRGVSEYWNCCRFEFTDNENEDLNERMKKIKNLLNAPGGKHGQQLLQARIGEVEDELNEVTWRLHAFLNNHERIFSKSTFKSMEEQLDEDF